MRHRNGRTDVTGWTSGPEPASNIIYARQNLPLIVLGAKPNPNLSDGPEWGARSATLSECGAPAWVSTGAAT